jgi:hypothetical protein
MTDAQQNAVAYFISFLILYCSAKCRFAKCRGTTFNPCRAVCFNYQGLGKMELTSKALQYIEVGASAVIQKQSSERHP